MDAHLLIVDDYRMQAESLEAYLCLQQGLLVYKSLSSLGEIRAFLQNHAVDILLISMGVNCKDLKASCNALRYLQPEMKIIFYACDDRYAILHEYLSFGINGYIHKTDSIEELLIAIQLVKEGKDFYSREIAHHILRAPDKNAQYSSRKKLLHPVSHREKEVLRLVLEEFTTEEIANKLCISIHTVETHRSNLFAKLNVRNVAGLVRKAIEYDILENEGQR